jgi:hypothetical protein
MAQLRLRDQALGVPQSGRDDTKPEASRLTANAITGLKPRPTRYEVTNPGCAGVQLRVMPAPSEVLVFSVLLAQRTATAGARTLVGHGARVGSRAKGARHAR